MRIRCNFCGREVVKDKGDFDSILCYDCWYEEYKGMVYCEDCSAKIYPIILASLEDGMKHVSLNLIKKGNENIEMIDRFRDNLKKRYLKSESNDEQK